MAIFHMHGSHGSRQGGQSALAKLMYVLRRGKYARGRDDLEASEWGHLPDWCAGDDPAPLFAGADLYERANARLYIELEGALPHELDLERCIELMRSMADAVAATGLPFVWAIHAGRPVAPGEPRNRHWHLVFLERINDRIRRLPERWFRRANRKDPAAGGAPKERSLKGHEWLPNVRRRYEELVNGALERAGRTERVTAASHRDRIARAEAIGDHETAEQLRRHPPGLHIGPTASAIERGRPGRNEQPTLRGDLARARDARAAHLRADLERIDGEMKEHLRVTVAAARDAGVDEALVTAAEANDPVSVVALVDATEIRRHEIRDAARRLGFDDDLIADIRATTEPDDADLGWTAVVESTEAYVGQVERAREIGLSAHIDAVMAGARRRRANPVSDLARLNDAWAKARGAGLDNDRLHDIYRGGETGRAGTGWTAIEDATGERVERKSVAEAAARNVFVDVDAVYRRAREGLANELEALEDETSKAEPVVAAAQEAGLDDAEIRRILRAAESKEYRAAWRALTRATAKRVERSSAAEAAARGLGLNVEVVYANVGGDVDPVDHLERVTAVWGQARRAGLNREQLTDLYRGAENGQAGTGWTAIEDATAERVQRKSAAEAAAGSLFVDVDAVYRRAREGLADELEALEDETSKAEPVVAAAREAGLDDAEIRRILRAAESKEYRAAWRALTRATAKRVERSSAAEAAARGLGLNVEVVYANVGGDVDPVDHLERVTAVWGQARRTGLNKEQLTDLYREAENRRAGTGWTAIEDATAERVQRKSAVEAAARSVFVDVDAVYRRAREGHADEFEALEDETSKAEPVVAAAREAGLDDAEIGRIYVKAESTEPGSGREAVSKATRRLTKERELRAKEEERKRREWADLTAEVRAASAGSEWLEERRRARLDTTKRPLTLDEEIAVVKEVKALIEVDLASRAATVDASPGGRELLRRVEHRRGGSPQRMQEREETIEAVELRVQTADEAEKGLMAPARDPERPDHRAPFVDAVLLDAVHADGNEQFLEDVVGLLHARFAHAEQRGGDRGGYDAGDREKLAQHHFGSAMARAFEWCVLRIRALILAACHRVLGGRGETGAHVQASLEAIEAAQQSYRRTVDEEALTMDIDPNAWAEEARVDGRDGVAAIIVETERRRQVISDATANHIDVDTVVRTAEAHEGGAWFPAVEAALGRFRTAAEAAPTLDLDVKAFCASARSRGEDPLRALEEETASRTRVRLLVDFVGLSFREWRDIYRAAEEQRRDSGYTAVAKECILRQTRELVRNELPSCYSDPGSQGTWALAVPDEAGTDLLREVQDDGFLHSRLSEVLASAPGSPEERKRAERRYHLDEIENEHQRLEEECGWLSATPTEEDALQAVRERFIPELADRLRAARNGVADPDRLVAHLVEDDWVRRVVAELPRDLPRERSGSGSGPTVASDERLSRIAAASDDPRAQKIVVAYQAQNAYTAPERQRAETRLLARLRHEREETGQTQADAEAAASKAHDAELLRILQDVCGRVPVRQVEEVCRERIRERTGTSTGPGVAHNHGAHERDPRDHPKGRSR